jgi:outer membrane protein assembly factor BamA
LSVQLFFFCKLELPIVILLPRANWTEDCIFTNSQALNTFRTILFLLLATARTVAQNSYTLEIHPDPGADHIEHIDYKKNFLSKTAAAKELRKFIFVLYDHAYLSAGIDSIHLDSTHTIAWVQTGRKYKWARLSKGNVDEGLLSEIGFREKLYSGKPLYYPDIRRMEEKILRSCENNGYPFAEIKLDSIQVKGDEFSATLVLTKYKLTKIDSVIIKGNAKIAPVYMYSYLGIKPGDLYNESKITAIRARLKEMAFVHELKPFEVLFGEKSTKLLLYLEKRKASQFDGILGVVPDPLTGKIQFTGDARLKLQNSFNHGEIIDLNWRKLQAQTQDLKVKLSYPFLFSTPLGVEYGLTLYKKDSTYLDVNQNFGLQYLLSGGNYFKVFLNNRTSSLLSTSGLQSITILPDYADVSSFTYGIGFRGSRLDYRLNPRKGYTFSITAGTGTKKIKENTNVNPLVYENLKLSSTQYNADLQTVYYISLGGRSVIKTGLNAAFISADNLFQNEMFRIGGLNTLRGFDEESIYASTFGIFTLEYHYILEQNSYLFAFADGAWYEKNGINSYVHDTPKGFGAGITFDTKAGIFSISYALGQQFNDPIQLKAGKVSFGFVSLF